MKTLLALPLFVISIHAQPKSWVVAWNVAKWDGSRMNITYYQDGSWPTTGWSLSHRENSVALGLDLTGCGHNYIYPFNTNLTVSTVNRFARAEPKDTYWNPTSSEVIEYYAGTGLAITNGARLPEPTSFSGPDLYGTKVVVDGTTKLVRHGSLTITLHNRSETTRRRWLFKCGDEGRTWEWEEILGPDEEKVLVMSVKEATKRAGHAVKYFGVYSVIVGDLLY